MENTYTCEGIEVTVDEVFDVLVDGSITHAVVGMDDEGCEIFKETVTIEAVYPVVLHDGHEEYSDFPLSFFPISWRATLVQAILDKGESDWEDHEDSKWNR